MCRNCFVYNNLEGCIILSFSLPFSCSFLIHYS
uniref:Uncharacterized protein n=1 Tax=Arundo donax TaxID=35708 RepID=A0A0A8YMZ6_ARUDO